MKKNEPQSTTIQQVGKPGDQEQTFPWDSPETREHLIRRLLGYEDQWWFVVELSKDPQAHQEAVTMVNITRALLVAFGLRTSDMQSKRSQSDEAETPIVVNNDALLALREAATKVLKKHDVPTVEKTISETIETAITKLTKALKRAWLAPSVWQDKSGKKKPRCWTPNQFADVLINELYEFSSELRSLLGTLGFPFLQSVCEPAPPQAVTIITNVFQRILIAHSKGTAYQSLSAIELVTTLVHKSLDALGVPRNRSRSISNNEKTKRSRARKATKQETRPVQTKSDMDRRM